MIIKDKIKLISKAKSKILVLGLILIILVGFFSPEVKVSAQTWQPGDRALCTVMVPDPTSNTGVYTYYKDYFTSYSDCKSWEEKYVPNTTLQRYRISFEKRDGHCEDTSGNIYEYGPISCASTIFKTYKWVNTGQNNDEIVSPGSNTSGDATTAGTCYYGAGSNAASQGIKAKFPKTKQECTNDGSSDWKEGDWTNGGQDKNGQTAPISSGTVSTGASSSSSTRDLFGHCTFDSNFSMGACITSWGYYILVTLPSYILYFTAYMFNIMLALTLGTVLYDNNFLPEAWRIVRDFSNIFFILVLLYISIKMILGLGGSDIKKMIVNVIIAALLINFSMFFTQVVIDSSNILALIFYNKINVVSANPASPSISGTTAGANTQSDIQTGGNYNTVVNGAVNGIQDKDIAAGIVTGFNPANFINPSVAQRLNTKLEEKPKDAGSFYSTVAGCTAGAVGGIVGIPIGCVVGYSLYQAGSNSTLPFAIALAIEVTAFAIYLFASYAFFMAGFSFIGRLIELWILIIFSPFAFMSLSIPQLEGVKYLGFKDWSERLIKTAFMAPIFMFFLLLITKLIQVDIFSPVLDTKTDTSIPRTLIIIAIPAIIYISMLYKATEYAKEGSGEFGKAVIKYGTMAAGLVGGLALTAASGGASIALTAGLGSVASAAKNSQGLKDAASQKGFRGAAARMALRTADYGSKASYDIRKIPGIGNLAKKAGINMEVGKSLGLGALSMKEGGYEQRRKERQEKDLKRAKLLEVSEDEPLKQALNKTESDLQELLGKNAKEIESIDKLIEKKKDEVSAASSKFNAAKGTAGEAAARTALQNANENLDNIKKAKKDLVTGSAYSYTDLPGTGTTTLTGAAILAGTKSIDDLEKDQKTQKQNIRNRNITRKRDQADSIENRWFWGRTNREVAHKIRMEEKLDSGTKH